MATAKTKGTNLAEMCTRLGAHLLELFELAGVKAARVAELACCRHGAPECRLRIGWPPESESAQHPPG